MNHEFSEETGHKLMRVVMITLALSAMAALMFNFVLPDISKTFGLTNAQVSWVTSSYALIYGLGTIIYGNLADRYQLKHLLTFGLSLFAIGSLIGFASQGYWMVILGRCLQAAGAAAIPAVAMVIPVLYFPPERRGIASGTAFVGLAIGSALGPVLSSFIVGIADWRFLFLFPLLLLLTLPFYRKYLVGERQGGTNGFDWLGGSLLAATVTQILLGVTGGTWWLIALGLMTLLLFVIRICTASTPFVQPQLFTKQYSMRLVIAFLVSGIGFSLYFLTPLLLADVQQLPASWIGYAMVPAAVASALLGKWGGRLADSRGSAYLFSLASGFLFLCFLLLSTFTGASPLYIAVFLIFGNVGQTFMMIAISQSLSQSLPKEQAGVGMGFLTMLNFIGGGFAAGVYGKVVDIGSEVHWNPVNTNPNGITFSNVFLVLALLHAGLLAFYYFQFVRPKQDQSKSRFYKKGGEMI